MGFRKIVQNGQTEQKQGYVLAFATAPFPNYSLTAQNYSIITVSADVAALSKSPNINTFTVSGLVVTSPTIVCTGL